MFIIWVGGVSVHAVLFDDNIFLSTFENLYSTFDSIHTHLSIHVILNSIVDHIEIVWINSVLFVTDTC